MGVLLSVNVLTLGLVRLSVGCDCDCVIWFVVVGLLLFGGCLLVGLI